MPDESRVFDVTRPSQVSPSHTSKPVIVGHRPETSDPMVKDNDQPVSGPTKISFTDDSQGDPSPQAAPELPKAFGEPDPEKEENTAPALFSSPSEQPEHHETAAEQTDAPAVFSSPEPEPAPMATETNDVSSTASTLAPFEPAAAAEPAAESPQPAPLPEQPQPHIEGLRFNQPKTSRRWLKFSIVAVLVLLIAAYLAIDSGAIGSGINLPFHIFKQKSNTPTPSANTPQKQSASTAPSLPAGFKEYKLNGTQLTFAAPVSWGDPTSTSEGGFSKRSSGAQSDGTYAYIVDFASNKVVEIAVTSGQFLPPTRSGGAILYYDFLKWCTGTNDGKFYESILHSTTANGVTTPTTVTCDQGPLANAQKLDSTTLLQPKVTDTTGKVVGDIYIKNLSDSNLVVLRVKDATMTNGDDIKQMLGTVQITAGSNSSSTGQ